MKEKRQEKDFSSHKNKNKKKKRMKKYDSSSSSESDSNKHMQWVEASSIQDTSSKKKKKTHKRKKYESSSSSETESSDIKCIVPKSSSKYPDKEKQKKFGKYFDESSYSLKQMNKFSEHQKRASSLERCEHCFDQPRMKKYLIIDVGNEVYLSLPNFQTVTEGHCLIIPKTHVPSFLCLDENEWAEVNDYKNHLRNLFRSESKSIIFIETSMNLRYFPHAVLECIPVPEEEGDMALFYFKKAIQESEAEWALNKKLIDLTNKGLRHSVPKNLPYFHVEFDPKVHAGYAHVIEDEKSFPRNFGKEVVGGMLDIDYNYLYKNRKEDSLKKSKEVVEFEKKWKRFKT